MSGLTKEQKAELEAVLWAGATTLVGNQEKIIRALEGIAFKQKLPNGEVVYRQSVILSALRQLSLIESMSKVVEKEIGVSEDQGKELRVHLLMDGVRRDDRVLPEQVESMFVAPKLIEGGEDE